MQTTVKVSIFDYMQTICTIYHTILKTVSFVSVHQLITKSLKSYTVVLNRFAITRLTLIRRAMSHARIQMLMARPVTTRNVYALLTAQCSKGWCGC